MKLVHRKGDNFEKYVLHAKENPISSLCPKIEHTSLFKKNVYGFQTRRSWVALDKHNPILVLFSKFSDDHLPVWAGYSNTNLVLIFLDFYHCMAYLPLIIISLL